MNDSAKLELARKLIHNLLSAGPMKGATLKLRMLRDFEAEAGQSFNTAFRLYPKFSSFLAANNDLVEVSRPATGMPGDITVRLRTAREMAEEPGRSASAPEYYLSNDIWQAFTNPDPLRLRFFNRATHKVIHYIVGQPTLDVAGDPSWVKVQPASASDQSGWMREFISLEPLPDSRRETLRQIADLPYSTSTNATFVSALGQYASVWKRFRTGMVIELVKRWCEDAHIPEEDVLHPAVQAPAIGSSISIEARLRTALIRAIEAATPDELRQISIPASLLTIQQHAHGK
jgi:hypothetical protein